MAKPFLSTMEVSSLEILITKEVDMCSRESTVSACEWIPAGWSSEQPALEEGVPASIVERLELGDLKGPCQRKVFYDSIRLSGFECYIPYKTKWQFLVSLVNEVTSSHAVKALMAAIRFKQFYIKNFSEHVF